MKSKVLFFAALLCILAFIGCQDEPSFSKEGESIMALKAKTTFNNQNHTLKIATYNLHLYLGPLLLKTPYVRNKLKRLLSLLLLTLMSFS